MTRLIAEQVLDVETLAGFYPLRQTDLSPQRLLALMDRHGIGQAAVCSARGVFYDDAEGNAETLAWCRSFTNAAGQARFLPVGTLDLRKYWGYEAQINECRQAGVRLWRLFPDYQAWDVEGAAFRQVAKALARAGCVLMLNAPPAKVLRAIEGLDLPLILTTHFYQMAELLALHEQGYTFYVSTRLLHGPGVIRRLADVLGSQRLILGSGAPLFSLGSALRVLEAAGLSAEEQRAVCSQNLLRLLGDQPC